jgi:hypothetical protein
MKKIFLKMMVVVLYSNVTGSSKTCDLVLKVLPNGSYSSYYWRAPPGSGKTTFLSLMGRELQSRGCEVYETLYAKSLDAYPLGFFRDLATNAKDKVVVLLIDEVQNNTNSDRWKELVKSKPRNLIVIGVGIPWLNMHSPQFSFKFPQTGKLFPMFLTETDLEEICRYFESITGRYRDQIEAICRQVLNYTNGHLFPFIKLTEHVLSTSDLKTDNVGYYLTSKIAYESPVLECIRRRCLSMISSEQLKGVEKLFWNVKESTGLSMELSRVGLWHGNDFISDLIRNEVFHTIDLFGKDEPCELQDPAKTSIPYIEQVICAGLKFMGEEDFFDPVSNTIAVENRISFTWAQYVEKKLIGVWVAPQCRTLTDERYKKVGPKPLLDFIINERFDKMAIEVALNQNSKGIQKHLKRFDYNYRDFKANGFIFHIQTNHECKFPSINMKSPYDTEDAKNRVYTFIKHQNTLYRGATIVRKGVSKYLKATTLIANKLLK